MSNLQVTPSTSTPTSTEYTPISIKLSSGKELLLTPKELTELVGMFSTPQLGPEEHFYSPERIYDRWAIPAVGGAERNLHPQWTPICNAPAEVAEAGSKEGSHG